MTRLDKYMQYPGIVNESMPLREVHAIRLMIYDDIKDMTSNEVTEYYNTTLETMRKKYNFNVATKG